MTTQDADDDDSEPASNDDNPDGSQNGDDVDSAGGEGAESLEDIAEEPTEDVGEVLAEIVAAEDAAVDPGETAVDPDSVEVDEEFVDAVAETSAEPLARGMALLRAEIQRLEAERQEAVERADDLESRLTRKQADFQNYKKRQQKRMEEEKQRATEDLVERLLDVRDNLRRALDQDEDVDIRGGVESTLEQFNRELEKENVEVVEPEVGDETDPVRHEVLATMPSDQPADTIAEVHRPGYEMAGKVLRPAQVAVSDGSGHDAAESEPEESEGEEADEAPNSTNEGSDEQGDT